MPTPSSPPAGPDPRHSSSPSSSSSSLDAVCDAPLRMAPPGVAQVMQPSTRNPPQLTAGPCSIETLLEWETGILKYQDDRGIAADQLADKVCMYIADKRTSDWVRANRAVIKGLSFPDFYTLLRPRLLGLHWDTNLYTAIASKMQGDLPFEDFSNEVRSANAHLVSSPLHMPDATIIISIQSRLRAELLKKITNNVMLTPLIATPDLWFAAVAELDAAHAALVKSVADANRVARNPYAGSHGGFSGGSGVSNSRSGTPRIPSSLPASRPTSSQSQQNPRPPRTMPPKLTEDECSLLIAHSGCFGCRKFYAGHMAADCPSKNTPLPADTQILNASMAATAKAKYDREQGAKPIPTTNAILIDGSDDYMGSCVLTGFGDDPYVPSPCCDFPICAASTAEPPPPPPRARSLSCAEDVPIVAPLLLWTAYIDVAQLDDILPPVRAEVVSRTTD
ncbi:hypothetical protein OF83DRAFT_1083876 [Amylostereum chailletii]|nr:hypothetical protein OF83DRAFT_1083876 [Amylostereum chailletii]